jgi:mono/diheme cytochrome c family protein
MSRSLLLSLCLFAVPTAFAAGSGELLPAYELQAKQANPQFQAFSATRGEQFYHAKRSHSNGKSVSCAACHTDNPKAVGRNEKTGKEIQALAPVANKERLTDSAKVEKWFKRNCQDVMERACTAQEKGDVLAYLMSLAK